MKTTFSNSLRNTTLAVALAVTFIGAGCKKAVDDATLTSNVQQKLASDSSISSEPIQVSTQGGIVLLNGQVSSAAARTLALNDAAAVPGVKQVVNNLTVAPAPTQAVETPAPAPAPVASTPEPKKEKVAKVPAKPAPAPAPVQRVPPPAPVAQTQPAPPPPPKPAFRDVTVPAGTTLSVRLTQTLQSGQNQTGDSFSGTLASDVVQDGVVTLRRGAPVSGRVVEAKDAAHFKGSSLLTIQLISVNSHGSSLPVSTDTISQEGKGRGKNTATKAGVGAAAGAILGGIFGGGKGAAIGAAAGGGAGVGVNAITKGEQVQFPSETVLRFHLTSPITVRVPND